MPLKQIEGELPFGTIPLGMTLIGKADLNSYTPPGANAYKILFYSQNDLIMVEFYCLPADF